MQRRSRFVVYTVAAICLAAAIKRFSASRSRLGSIQLFLRRNLNRRIALGALHFATHHAWVQGANRLAIGTLDTQRHGTYFTAIWTDWPSSRTFEMA